MKKKIKVIGLLALFTAVNLKAQLNSSWDSNTTPIYGTNNCGFGFNAMNNGGYTAPYNTATGHSALVGNKTGENNVANGAQSLKNNVAGNANVANGFQALYGNNADGNTATGHSALFKNSTGIYNTANGHGALYTNSTGNENTATGYNAAYSCAGSDNTALGHNAMNQSTSAQKNFAMGKDAMYNVTGTGNVAFGRIAMVGAALASGSYNVGIGSGCLSALSTGNDNLAIGVEAMKSNSSGSYNQGFGNQALYKNTSGSDNIAFGDIAMYENLTGSDQIAIGYSALHDYKGFFPGNTIIGYNTGAHLSTGYATAFGYQSLFQSMTAATYDYGNSTFGALADVTSVSYGNATAIGFQAKVNNNNKMRLGNVNVTAVETQVAIAAPSDGRFKFNISEKDIKGVEFIEKLRPLVYNFDTKKFDAFLCKNIPDSVKQKHLNNDYTESTAIRQSGFIAQEVEKAAKETNFTFNGITKPATEDGNYGLSYDMFVVPLVKAVQEQQSALAKQKKINDDLKRELEDRKTALNNLQQKPGDGINGFYRSVTGFSMEQKTSEAGLPSISYTLPNEISSTYLALYDLSGKQLNKISLSPDKSGSVIIPSQNLNAGIYIYSFQTDSQILGSGKVALAGK